MKPFCLKGRWPTLIIFFVILLVPVFWRSPYMLTNMVTAAAYAIIAMATGLVLGQAGLLSFGTAAFAGVGAYTTAVLVKEFNCPTLLAVVAGALLSGIVGLIVGKPVLRFRPFFLALATMGWGTIFTVIIMNWRSITVGTTGIAGLPYLNIGGFSFSEFIHQYYLMWVVVLALALFSQTFLRSRVGRALLALNSNEIAAKTLGINTAAWKLRVFVVSCVFAGLGGSLWVLLLTSVGPNMFSNWISVLAILMVMIGGQYSIIGGVVGAIVMTWLGVGLTQYSEYSSGIYSVILILLIIFLPAGLAGIMTTGKLPRLREWLLHHFRVSEWRARLRPASEPAAAGAEVQRTPPVAPQSSQSLASGTPANAAAATIVAPPVAAEPLEAPTPVESGTSLEEPRLRIAGVTVNFGGLHALSGVTFDIPRGLISALIGPNGAGKTTLFNVITGLQAPTAGEVWFEGKNLTRMQPANIARLGMARTFQNLRIFGNLNVVENVMVGRHRHEKSHFIAAGLRIPSSRREERESRRYAMELLELLGIADRAEEPAGSLPYGQQRLVEIARALATEPSLLLLDEPAAGMNTSEREVLVEKILAVHRSGIDVLIVEHDMDLIMGMSQTVAVLEHGSLIANGPPAEVQCDPAVIRAYLGTKEHLTVSTHVECLDTERSDDGSETSALLRLEDVSTYYGVIGAVRDVSLDVRPGEVFAVLGANGAGKSTLLHTIAGALHPQPGRVIFDGQDITGLSSSEVARRGVAVVPEGRHVFPTLSTFENLELGGGKIYKGKEFQKRLAAVYEVFPVLAERHGQPAGSLSGGEQQMLAIGRGLMSAPRLLLLDEPSMGLAPLVAASIFETLVRLNQDGLTMLMVEQNAEAALTIAHRAIVMVTGRVALRGSAEAVRNTPNLHELYLGSAECFD